MRLVKRVRRWHSEDMKRGLWLRQALVVALAFGWAMAGSNGEEKSTIWAPGQPVTLTFGPFNKPIPVTVLVPKGYVREKPCPVILALPPGEGDPAMVESGLQSYWRKEAFERGYIVVSPAINGVSLLLNSLDFFPVLFRWMDQNLGYDKDRVALVGVSNGGLGVFFAALIFPERFGALVAIPGGYRGDPRHFRVLRNKPVWLLVGENDPQWVEQAKDTKEGLTAAGARVQLDILPGQGHGVTIDPKRLYDWIDANLRAK